LRRWRSYLHKLLTYPQPHRGSWLRRRLYRSLPLSEALHVRLCRRRLGRATASGAGDGPRFVMAVPYLPAGLGHAMGEWLTGLILARRCGARFVHTALPEPWEDFFRFGDGEAEYREVMDLPNLEIIRLPPVSFADDTAFRTLSRLIDGCRAVHPLLFIAFDGQQLHDYTGAADVLGQKYRRRAGCSAIAAPFASPLTTSSAVAPLTVAPLTVAMHIRRGDLETGGAAAISDWALRHVGLERFLEIGRLVRDALPDRPLAFRVVSEGDAGAFRSLDALTAETATVTVDVDPDPRRAFAALVAADILITSPSSFSYMAGVISTGYRIGWTPWYHRIPVAPDWYGVSRQADIRDRGLAGHLRSWTLRNRPVGG
jgi:hypothetical protein